jgi:hypothetical protein
VARCHILAKRSSVPSKDELINTDDRNDAFPFQDPRDFAVKAQAGWKSAIECGVSETCTNAISYVAWDGDLV